MDILPCRFYGLTCTTNNAIYPISHKSIHDGFVKSRFVRLSTMLERASRLLLPEVFIKIFPRC